jgi:hypothetical protein
MSDVERWLVGNENEKGEGTSNVNVLTSHPHRHRTPPMGENQWSSVPEFRETHETLDSLDTFSTPFCTRALILPVSSASLQLVYCK